MLWGCMLANDAHYLRVFTDKDGGCGDVASVVIDEGRHVSDIERRAIADKLHTGETIFVNDVAKADISVVHPQGEIGFAGVGVLAAAWLLAMLGDGPIKAIHAQSGEIRTWQADGLTWARASLAIMPPWNYKQLDSPEEIENIMQKDTSGWLHTVAWAWADKDNGVIRARTFAADWDIPEAQGNGSGSMVLAVKLNRAIEVQLGEGAVIFAKPAANNCADVGGRVCLANG